jgi:hypothetical protein
MHFSKIKNLQYSEQMEHYTVLARDNTRIFYLYVRNEFFKAKWTI